MAVDGLPGSGLRRRDARHDRAGAVPLGDLRGRSRAHARDGEDARRKLSRFWVLRVFAAVIGSAGVVSNSTATVIGAMIVAPLMTPILGTLLSVVLDRDNLARSPGLVVSGAALVVAIGWLFGTLVPFAVVADSNDQVAGRVHPQLFDLIAALATGAVGSFALVRSDISDTLPGVAIAISLVPPLAVVGITLESGASDEAAGALVLFPTNAGAILLSRLAVMALYRVARVADAETAGGHRRVATVTILAFVVAVTIPLAVSTSAIVEDALDRADVEPVASRWAAEVGWRVTAVNSTAAGTEVGVTGPPPPPELPDDRRVRGADGGLVWDLSRLAFVHEHEESPATVNPSLVTGLSSVPEGMAYASIGGFNPVLGPYCGMLPALLGSLAGSRTSLHGDQGLPAPARPARRARLAPHHRRPRAVRCRHHRRRSHDPRRARRSRRARPGVDRLGKRRRPGIRRAQACARSARPYHSQASTRSSGADIWVCGQPLTMPTSVQ
jgi:uncharacterized hydrophobic protein (TIGR00271 family)